MLFSLGWLSCAVLTPANYCVVHNLFVLFSHQTYYYNARTRESAWTKPEGVKIITQSEVEQMAAQQAQQQGQQQPQTGSQQPQQQVSTSQPSGTTTATQAAVAQGEFILIIFRIYLCEEPCLSHIISNSVSNIKCWSCFSFSAAKWPDPRRTAAVLTGRWYSTAAVIPATATFSTGTAQPRASTSHGRTTHGISTSWLSATWPARPLGYVLLLAFPFAQ